MVESTEQNKLENDTIETTVYWSEGTVNGYTQLPTMHS